jgi:integrase
MASSCFADGAPTTEADGTMAPAMPPPRRGSIRRKQTQLGTSYALRIRWQGKQHYHYLGGDWEGWTDERAHSELRYVTAQVERGEYMPPKPSAAPPDEAGALPTFQVFASIVLARKKRRVAEKSYRDLEWRLRIAVDHVGSRRLDEIDAGVADEVVDRLLRDREAIEEAAAAGRPLTETYTDPRTGRDHVRRRWPLSNGSINKVLAAIRLVLKEAVRSRLIDHNPLADPDCFLRVGQPARSFLEAGEVLERKHRGLTWDDVLAIRRSDEPGVRLARRYGVSDTLIRKVRRREIWTRKAQRRRNDVPRAALLTTLVLAGIRISELCLLDGRHMDFARRTIHVPRVKTDAAERSIPMVPRLYEVLLEHRAEFAYGPNDPVFGTRLGTRNTPDNVRTRIVAPVHVQANEFLEAARLAPIAQLTPHTLRRTFASILAELGVPPRRAMYLLGHRDPKFTMRVYQQVLNLGGGGQDQLESALGCTCEEAFVVLTGRVVRGLIEDPPGEMPQNVARGPSI